MNLNVTINNLEPDRVYALVVEQLKVHKLDHYVPGTGTYNEYVDWIAKTWPCSRDIAEAIARHNIRCVIPALVGCWLEPYRKYAQANVDFTEKELRELAQEFDKIFTERR